MRIRNADRAVVDLRKLTEYCLSESHPRGRHKARVFRAALGLDARDAEELRETLLQVVSGDGAFVSQVDRYGMRYSLDFEYSRADKRANVRSLWIVRAEEDFPRLLTCFVLG